MLIKLKWLNKNDASAVIQVFRSTATIDTANPGTPLATLVGSATEYSDSTAVIGTVYYYAVAVVKGANKLFTPVKVFNNVATRGPGVQNLLWGDERFGYYGTLVASDFIDLCRFLGLPTATSAYYANFVWHKFIRKGKILYITDKPLFSNALATSAHAHSIRKTIGLVSGMTWGFNNSTWIDAAKTAIADLNGTKLHFRALRGLPDDWDGTAPTAAMVNDPKTEFNEIIQCLTSKELYFPSKVGTVRLGTVVTPQMNAVICAEKVGTTSLCRELQANPAVASAWTTLSSRERTQTAFLNFTMRSDPVTEPGINTTLWSSIWPMFELID